MSEHTKGQVKYRGCETLAVVETLGGREAEPIAHCGGPNALGNARRLAACWNACEGLETDQLEALPEPFAGLALGELMAVRKELAAARALLREVMDEGGTVCLRLDDKVLNYLGACDTIGDGNG